MERKPRIAFFLPARKGSQRVKNKNTRTFAGIEGGLLANKLQQLLQTERIDEIILSTNDEESLRIGERYARQSPRLRVERRPDELCLDSTNLQDLINYVPTVTDAEHILWGHVTTPLAGAEEYDAAVEAYLKALGEGYDSLVGVSELRNFLLDASGRLINNTTPLPWPRTQDLAPLYEINHTVFLASREIYVSQRNRLGQHPALFVMDKIHSLDIDWEEDFTIAESLMLARQAKKG